MKPTQLLIEEHNVIKRIFNVLEKAINKLEKNQRVNPEIFDKAVDFIRNFADKCHHAKEEELLFKKMVEKGISSDSGPIEVMLAEHEKGRAFVRGIEGANKRFKKGDRESAKDIIHNSSGYIELLKEHIDKEDNILYPAADNLFSEEEQEDLMSEFENVERHKIGHGVHERYLKLIKELEREMGTG